MLIDDQSDVIAVLKQPKTYGLKRNQAVDIVETNISLVFLAGDKAYKLQKGVKFPYADFSTPEKRLEACQRELMACERFATGICLGIEPIVADKKGRLSLREFCRDPQAQVCDWLLVMHRFPEEDFYRARISDGSVDRFEMMDLAEKIWELHKTSPVFMYRGGAEVIRRRIVENNTLMKCFPAVFDKEDVDRLDKAQLKELSRQAALLDKRRDKGKIRWCHGDLRLTNVVMFENRVTLFNPISFYDDLTQIDSLYDIAFLLMDMSALGLKRLTSILFNHYMACSADWEGIPVLPLFMSCRAGVQAYVFAQRANDAVNAKEKEHFTAEARRYLDLACDFLNPTPPAIVACGGLSGSGKSRMAREAAPEVAVMPGAVVLRDDVLRKNMENVAQTDDLGEFSFLNEKDEQAVYDRLFKEAENVILNGHSVMLDALFFKPEFRLQAEALAEKLNVKFCGFWVDAPLDVRAQRVAKRKRNPSDVKSLDTLKKQLDIDVGEVSWHKIDSSRDREETLKQVFKILRENGI